MVNATIDNTPVSIQLGLDESTTVPTNETWKVSLSVFGSGFDGLSENSRIELNGRNVLGLSGDMQNGPVASPTVSFVLAGDDTLICRSAGNTSQIGAAIQGFVVHS